MVLVINAQATMFVKDMAATAVESSRIARSSTSKALTRKRYKVLPRPDPAVLMVLVSIVPTHLTCLVPVVPNAAFLEEINVVRH